MRPALELCNFGKVFGDFWALRGVDMCFFPGRIHALVGENGAGKSTLIKMLAGVYPLSEGALIDDKGQELHIKTPRDALQAGIGVVHQELDLFNNLTVAENISLGLETTNFFKPAGTVMEERARAALEKLQERRIKPWVKVGDLSTSDKQLVAIAKVLEQQVRVIILDEPTSALNAAEAARLLACVAHLKTKNVAVIYVSHKLGEIFSIADEIAVLRDGKRVLSDGAAALTHQKIVAAMLGRELADIFPDNNQRKKQVPEAQAQTLLQVKNVVGAQLSGVSLTAKAGEIIALAGLPDAGPCALLRHIFGLQKLKTGTIVVRGQIVHHMTARRAIRLGLAYLPADRLLDGILPLMDVLQNAESTDKAMRLSSQSVRRQRALSSIKQLAVRAPSLQQNITALSGGNQQKTLLARWLSVRPSVLMLDDPTRGVDIGAKSEIYHILHQLRDHGVTVIFTSSDSLELANLADRVLFFRHGKIVEERQTTTHEEIDRLIAAA